MSGTGATAPARVPESTALGLIAAGAVASAGLAVIGSPLPPPPVPFVAHVAGMLAGYAVAIMLILMARIPALEAGVGADRLVRWHAVGGRSVIALILLHGAAATLGWAQVQQISPVTAFVQVLGFPGLVAATAGTVLFVLVAAVSVRAARRRLDYETWHLVHLCTYLAVALSFVHELAGPDLAGVPVFQVFWSLLYTFAFALVLRYRLLDPLLRYRRHRMHVARVDREAPGVVSLTIRGRHLDALHAEPGQFFRWRFLTTGTWHLANPFSLSAVPTEHALRLTVKAVGAGTRAIHAVPVGTRVLAEGPYGAMTEHRTTGSGVLLLAGGVGITPMRTLFESIPAERLTLLYRAGSEEEVLFLDELREIARRRRADLRILTGRSSDPANALSAANLRAWVPDVAHRDVYLCASPRFSAAARDALRDTGVPARRIHQEEFVF